MGENRAGEEGGAPRGERLTIGQMAKIHNVSERTLRIYHQMGLLVPQYVDSSNSYRYYSEAQSLRLDLILQMKSAGLALKQIWELLDSRDITLFQAILCQKMDLIDAQIRELTATKKALQKKLNSYQYLLSPPRTNHIFVEYQPQRTAYYFEFEPYDLIEDVGRGTRQWEKNLFPIKKEIRRKNIFNVNFSEIGCVIGEEDIRCKKLRIRGAFMMADGEKPESSIPWRRIQGGIYVCYVTYAKSGDSDMEIRHINLLLEYAAAHGLEICGDYLGEVIAKQSAIDGESDEILVKMQLPVRLTRG